VGGNLQIEYRYSQGRTDRIPALVAELVALDPEVIVAGGPSAVAVHATAPTIPLVFMNVADPVGLGLVENLAHPGGNVTGFATTVPEGLVEKQLQLLKAIVPQASRIAVLINPTNPVHRPELPRLSEIGRLLGVELFVVELKLGFGFETTTAPTGRGVPIGTHKWFGSFNDTSVPCASLLNKISVSRDHTTLSAGFASHLAKIAWNS
jgi:putative tryptophan/tyrosine transport system substrate-binding protein